jgi:hypothetical protein
MSGENHEYVAISDENWSNESLNGNNEPSLTYVNENKPRYTYV